MTEKNDKKIGRPGVREGYDRWSDVYDGTPNPLVALDRRHTLGLLRAQPAERILDAGCGTGTHLGAMLIAGAAPVGLDFSRGMLRVARRKHRAVPLVQADLNQQLPVRPRAFDAVLCALVGEHLTNLSLLFDQLADCLVSRGRLLFSVFHPEMAAAGIEANFEQDGIEYRLGAYRHRVDDYLSIIDDAGFRDVAVSEFSPDEALVDEVPRAKRYLGRPLLLTVEARKH
jgi:SAM-dependent methyltransferase